jgi:hypothetical protein
LRKDWAVQAKEMKKAKALEEHDKPTGQRERVVRMRLKKELSAQKQEYYQNLAQKAREERLAKKALRLQFWEKKQAVLADARKEMIKALVEDEGLWETHPKELMNRRYLTFQGKHFLNSKH